MVQPNPHEPGSLAYQMHEAEQWRTSAQAAEPIQWPKGFGEWVAGMGCVFFLFGVLWSISAQGVLGHVILIVGTTLFGMALAVAGYAIVLGPRFLFGLLARAWRGTVLARAVMIGAVVGLALGAWLGLSIHGGNLLRGMLAVGALGTLAGLIVGGVWTFVASRRRKSGR